MIETMSIWKKKPIDSDEHVYYFAIQWHDTKDVTNEYVSAPNIKLAIEKLKLRLGGDGYGIVSITPIKPI